MTLETLPAWAALPAAFLLILGGLCTAIGSLGLVRLNAFFERMHGPSMGNTLGTGCVLLASSLVSTALANRLVVHEILITAFIVLTAPMTAMLLMRAAVHRSNWSVAVNERAATALATTEAGQDPADGVPSSFASSNVTRITERE